MMHFRDLYSPHPLLEVVGDQQNPNVKVLLLKVQPPAIGVFSPAIGGLLVQGHFYDEVVSSARELTQIDTQGKLLLPKSYLYLFSVFYGLEKDDLHEVMNPSQGNLRIILKKSQQDPTFMSSKGASDQLKEKLHPSSKPEVKSNDNTQVNKTLSKSRTSKEGDMPLKSKSRRLTLVSKVTFTTFKVGHGSSGTNELHISSNNDAIVIDDNDFVDEDPNSASLSKLAKQELYSYDLRNDVAEYFTIDLNVASKGFHSSLNDVMPLLEVVPPRKSLSTSSDDKKFPQQNDGFTEFESSIVVSLEKIRKVNIIDTSALEDLVENSFKSYTEYDTLKLSKMTKE
ncbi:hypothetical protein KY285_026835 [Solanum tuberosum]|nr:hypothetical protein KY289_029692 [Solanum tuberosum]KAH0661923.1 hypothetical protein KY284_026854 [Solanum tuberosum]KAH0665629.1 hypothetical protein KY285_026835 [Solanum tuberosum]